MEAIELIDISVKYLGVIAVLFPICYRYGKFFKDDKLNIISTILPVGLIPFASLCFVIFSPQNTKVAALYAQEFVVLIIILFWVISCLLLYRKLFTYLTSYQVVCFLAYLLSIEVLGINYAKQVIIYSVLFFSLGLFILIRFGRVSGQESGGGVDAFL